jgi:hypothetical protein
MEVDIQVVASEGLEFAPDGCEEGTFWNDMRSETVSRPESQIKLPKLTVPCVKISSVNSISMIWSCL